MRRVDFYLLAINLLFAVFPAFYLVDRIKAHGLLQSYDVSPKGAESYFSSSVNSLFVLLVRLGGAFLKASEGARDLEVHIKHIDV